MYLDTHVVVWLYAGEVERFPPRVCGRIEEHGLLVSPMVLLELQYLYEIGRLLTGPETMFEHLAASIGLGLCGLPFGSVIAASLQQTWTRDPFDRIIVAHALVGKRVLLTKDARIPRHCPLAVWDGETAP